MAKKIMLVKNLNEPVKPVLLRAHTHIHVLIHIYEYRYAYLKVKSRAHLEFHMETEYFSSVGQ